MCDVVTLLHLTACSRSSSVTIVTKLRLYDTWQELRIHLRIETSSSGLNSPCIPLTTHPASRSQLTLRPTHSSPCVPLTAHPASPHSQLTLHPAHSSPCTPLTTHPPSRWQLTLRPTHRSPFIPLTAHPPSRSQLTLHPAHSSPCIPLTTHPASRSLRTAVVSLGCGAFIHLNLTSQLRSKERNHPRPHTPSCCIYKMGETFEGLPKGTLHTDRGSGLRLQWVPSFIENITELAGHYSQISRRYPEPDESGPCPPFTFSLRSILILHFHKD